MKPNKSQSKQGKVRKASKSTERQGKEEESNAVDLEIKDRQKTKFRNRNKVHFKL